VKPCKCIVCGVSNQDYRYWDVCGEECANKVTFSEAGTYDNN